MCDMINQMNAEVKRYLNKIYQEKFDAAMTKAMNTMKEEAEEKAVQEKEETVINMLENQISVDLIGKIMNMSIESVMNIATAYGIVIEEPLLNKA